MRVYYTADPRRTSVPPRLICDGTEPECRRAAARALGAETLRGLAQAPSVHGVTYYAAGTDRGAHDAPRVELWS